MSSITDYAESLPKLNVDNVYIYAGDAVRWGFLSDEIEGQGITIKTVSASTTSAPSFTSILSGLYPTAHQVFSFNNRLSDEILTMLDLQEFHTGFLNSIFRYAEREHDGIDPIYRTLGISEPPTYPGFDNNPFVFVERGPGGHAPYGDFSGGATEYFKENHDRTEDELKTDYERSIELDAQLFEKRVDELQSKGLLDNTLIVYTSDHGELLGENGMVGHNSPMCSEAVHVPTVFIHPDLPNGRITDGIIGHVDLFPTILDILDVEHDSGFDGQSVVGGWPNDPRCTIYDNKFLTNQAPLTDGRLRYDGVWDQAGGYVFPRSSLPERLLVLMGKIYASPKRAYLRNNLLKAFNQYRHGERMYGDPGFSNEEAKRQLEKLHENSATGFRQEIGPSSEEQLKDLGYL